MQTFKFLSVFLLFLTLPALAEIPTSVVRFDEGTQAYLAKDYKKAQDLFTQSLQSDPNNASVLTNLALSEFHLGNKPLSVGLLRKALASDPELATAKAGLKFVLSQMQIPQVPHNVEYYESLRQQVLQPIPLSAYLILSALFFLAAGWSLLSYFGHRRRALQEEKALPNFSLISLFLSLGFVIFTGLVALKIYDESIARGTIIVEKVSLQTAPGENQVSVLDLYGGLEVVIRSSQGEWVQITYPGSLTGWVKKSSLLMTR